MASDRDRGDPLDTGASGHQPAQCPRCASSLAGADERIAVAGQRVHRVSNPAGHRFVLSCFAAAPGCVAAGQSSDEASWFAGHTWQRAFCRRCSTHVGWLFRSKTGAFYGLLAGPPANGPHPVLGGPRRPGK